MRRRVPLSLTQNARTLRTHATDVERLLWHRLSQYRPRFTRQLPIGPFIVDLACRRARLAIELDGSQHLSTGGYDGRRTAFLEAQGWTVLRLWNSDVATNPDGAAEHILQRAAECLGGTHPQPLPGREGRLRVARRR